MLKAVIPTLWLEGERRNNPNICQEEVDISQIKIALLSQAVCPG